METVSAIDAPELPALLGDAPLSGVTSGRALSDALDAWLDARFRAGDEVDTLVHARARGVDRLLLALWQDNGLQGRAELLAIGGYGRGELHPRSDVDVLILTREGGVPAEDVRRFVAAAWDAGIEIGHSVRSLAQCTQDAEVDLTLATAFMEARLLSGDTARLEAFRQATGPDRIWPSERFFAAKWSEQQERHRRFNDTAYNLEPNLKDGPGGLRDLQVIAWVAKRHYRVEGLADLVTAGFLDADELRALERAQKQLWRLRFGLHLLAGRREDRLLFDYQVKLAQLFGYADQHRENLAVEQLMQGFYRNVMLLERLNERLLQRFQEDILFTDAARSADVLDERFLDRGGFIEARHPQDLIGHPEALIELFAHFRSRVTAKGIRAGTLHAVERALAVVGPQLPRHSLTQARFLELLKQPTRLFETLSRMNRCGLLSACLPAWGKVVGRMQYDLFHVYTVDQHTLFVLRNLVAFARSDSTVDPPLARDVYRRLRKPHLLFLAGLFHDIAKGRGGDHSVLGEQDVREFGAGAGMSAADIDLVAWLVRNHLVMSVTAQRQDISDPDVVNRFASEVADWERLDYLYLLTVADIRGTSPKLWNSWKDRLLADLYQLARYALRRGLEHPIHASERVAETKEMALVLLRSRGIEPEAVQSVWADFPAQCFLRYSADQIAWQTDALAGANSAADAMVAVRANPERGTTEVFVSSPDRDGLFATITAVLDRLRLDVVEARVINSARGRSLDLFQVLDTPVDGLDPQTRHEEIVRCLQAALAPGAARVKPGRRLLSRQLRHFQMKPRIEIEPRGRRGLTQLALVCSDRPGLLASIAQALWRSEVRVHEARIATFGERAEDFFLVSDRHDRPIEDARMLARIEAAVNAAAAVEVEA